MTQSVLFFLEIRRIFPPTTYCIAEEIAECKQNKLVTEVGAKNELSGLHMLFDTIKCLKNILVAKKKSPKSKNAFLQAVRSDFPLRSVSRELKSVNDFP